MLWLFLGNNDVTKQGQTMDKISTTEQERNACQGMARLAYRIIQV